MACVLKCWDSEMSTEALRLIGYFPYVNFDYHGKYRKVILYYPFSIKVLFISMFMVLSFDFQLFIRSVLFCNSIFSCFVVLQLNFRYCFYFVFPFFRFFIELCFI